MQLEWYLSRQNESEFFLLNVTEIVCSPAGVRSVLEHHLCLVLVQLRPVRLRQPSFQPFYDLNALLLVHPELTVTEPRLE